MPVIGWLLDRKEREALLDRFPPEWPDVIADHITLDTNADLKDPLPEAKKAVIVGGINDGEGLQAMVVAVDGSTDRPDADIHLGSLAKRCRVAFDLVPVVRVEG